MRRDFEQIADAVCEPGSDADRVSLAWAAESSEFIRFNHAAVRQATHVFQRHATLSVARGARQSSVRLALTGDALADTHALMAEREALAAQLTLVPEDPYLLLPDTVTSTERDAAGSLPDARQVIEAVTKLGAETDLVGFYAGGPVSRGFADSRGQRNWHRVESFHFEWCLYRGGDQAVKSSIAGTRWDEDALEAAMGSAREKLALMARPARTLQPGAYRAYFAPAAVADLLGTLSWGGFGHRDVATGVSTLTRARQGQASFHPSVTLTEATETGTMPRFQPDGFVKPASVPLVRQGKTVGTLVSPRSAREYGLPTNGAGPGESPESIAMAGGALAEADVLRALDTGVYVSDLHYLNYSDRLACRMTGMTRFACFWVERGRIVAPIAVMRFDDSLLRMFGEGLLGLTQATQLVPDPSTYGQRSLACVTAPGALVEGFRLTL